MSNVKNLTVEQDMQRALEDLLDWYNLVLFAGTMPDTMRATLRDYIVASPNDSNGRFAAAQDTLFMVMVSPALNIQR